MVPAIADRASIELVGRSLQGRSPVSERHNFDLGDVVTVFNRTPKGFVIEGRACITQILEQEDHYKVRFLEKRGIYPRYVDPNGQENPEAYLAKLNASIREVVREHSKKRPERSYRRIRGDRPTKKVVIGPGLGMGSARPLP